MNNLPTPFQPRAQSPIRVGLIGVTGYALAYFEALSALIEQGRLQWAAVTIINPEEAPKQVEALKRLGVPIYKDYRDMLDRENQNIDWICIPTSIGSHTKIVLDSLSLGLQVLVEKPLAPTLQDVAAIQAAELSSGIRIAVGFQHAYLKETWEIKERLLAGEIGNIERIDCIGLWPRSESYYRRNNWAGHMHDGESWVLDSPLHNGLSHLVNLILFWAGDTLEERGDFSTLSAELYRAKPVDGLDTVRTEVEMLNGIQASVVLSHSCFSTIDPEIRIQGSKGSFLWRFCGHHTFYVGEDVYSMRMPGQVRLREQMFESIVDHLEGKPVRICTTELAKGVCKWVNAAHDTVPVMDIPAKYRQRIVDDDGEVFDVVDNIEYYAMQAYQRKESFAEAGAPWAIEAREREVAQYDAFEERFSLKSYRPDVSPRAG